MLKKVLLMVSAIIMVTHSMEKESFNSEAPVVKIHPRNLSNLMPHFGWLITDLSQTEGQKISRGNIAAVEELKECLGLLEAAEILREAKFALEVLKRAQQFIVDITEKTVYIPLSYDQSFKNKIARTKSSIDSAKLDIVQQMEWQLNSTK